MGEREPLCIYCKFCPNPGKGKTLVDVEGNVTAQPIREMERTCGAGPTQNPDQRCENSKYETRGILYARRPESIPE